MTAGLTGVVDGQVVIFKRVKGNSWTAIVPRTLSGKYIAEFTAWDEAGNYTYKTMILFTIDTANLCVHWEFCPYHAELLPTTYYCEIIEPPLCRNGGRR